MKGKDIVRNAREKKNYKYWYGAKGETASAALASSLMRQNPNVWTNAYFMKALEDIKTHATVCDCSGFVCICYGMNSIGTYQMGRGGNGLKEIPVGLAEPGMIAWKNGHCGIIIDDDMHVAEMRGIDYDYQETRTFVQAGFTKVLYMPGVDYSMVDVDIIVGWHRDNSGWWYRYKEGHGHETYYHDCVKIINGHCYAFDSDGYICEIGQRLGKRIPPDSKTGWLD
jgi:hypothetical protein